VRTLPGGHGGNAFGNRPGADALHEVKLTPRRLNRCMMLEYDAQQQRWRDALRRTPPRGMTWRDVRGTGPQGQTASAPQVASQATALSPAAADGFGPIAVGLMLAVCPPVGVTMAWTSNRIPREGKVALTVFGGMVMALATIVGLALVVL
jgi:hypothetical protein